MRVAIVLPSVLQDRESDEEWESLQIYTILSSVSTIDGLSRPSDTEVRKPLPKLACCGRPLRLSRRKRLGLGVSAAALCGH